MADYNIDARLDRLTERHEALTQTVELMAGQMVQIMGGIGRLLHVAEIHERRLSDLEGK